jgi:hypothetical protein
VAPNLIWNLCDLTEEGVSVSCWNHLTLGDRRLCLGEVRCGSRSAGSR